MATVDRSVPVKRVAQEVLRVVQPAAVEAAVRASRETSSQQDAVLDSLRTDLEAALYAAARAQKQYDAADPENRLVADELERRWDSALGRVRELEHRIEEHRSRQAQSPVASVDEFAELADDLEAVWHDPDSDAALKKRIVRTLIREVIADIDYLDDQLADLLGLPLTALGIRGLGSAVLLLADPAIKRRW